MAIWEVQHVKALVKSSSLPFSSDSRCRSMTISVARILTSHWAGLSPLRGPHFSWIRRMG